MRVRAAGDSGVFADRRSFDLTINPWHDTIQASLSLAGLEATRANSGGSVQSDPGSGLWGRRRAGLLAGITTTTGGDGGGGSGALGRGAGQRPVLPLVVSSVNHGTVLYHGDEEQLPAEPLRRVYVQVSDRTGKRGRCREEVEGCVM